MIVLPARLLPYIQHFLFFVVLSSLPLAALFFTIGSLTRNVKVVYSIAAAFYVAYIGWQNVMKAFPLQVRIALDPLLFNVHLHSAGATASRRNAIIVQYDASLIANRIVITAVSLLCLAVLHLRFSTLQRVARREDVTLNLAGRRPTSAVRCRRAHFAAARRRRRGS